jgi:hypothetical protein
MPRYRPTDPQQVLGLLARQLNDIFVGLARIHARADGIEAELAAHRRLHRHVLQRLRRSLRPARDVVMVILGEVDPTAMLVDLDEVDGVYSVQLALPGEAGKAIRIPARVLDRATTDPQAWRTTWNVIRTAVLGVRTQRNISDVRGTLARSRSRGRSAPLVGRCSANARVQPGAPALDMLAGQ